MIALSMIALGLGDEPKQLRRALKSIVPYIDAVFITLTGPKDQMGEVEEILHQIKAEYKKPVNISYEREKSLWTITQEQNKWLQEFLGWEPYGKIGETVFLFDVARNYNMAQIPKDYKWILWMDCDDIFRGGNKLKEVIANAEKENIEAIYFNYLYEVEIVDNKIKNVIIEHLRERIILNDGSHKWVAPIHETLIEQRPTKKKDYQDCDLLHLAELKKRENSLKRNLRALEYSIYQTKGKDPRPLYYYAKACYDMRTLEGDKQASALIAAYLHGENKSGWPEERAQACEYMCEIYRRHGDHDKSIRECFNSLIEEISPTAFLNLAYSYMIKGEYERALNWAKIAGVVEGKKTTLVLNPRDIQAKTLEILYNCHLNLNHVDEAWALAVKMAELFPENENTGKALQFMESLRQQRDVTKSIMHIADYLKRSGEVWKIKPLTKAIPTIAENNPFTVELVKQHNPPKYWEDNEIAIWVGPGFTNWSPKQLKDPKGSFVGGSEEAVILNSRELAKLGWKITIYGDPGLDEGEYEGVTYLPYYKFNHLDKFNIIISWRQPGFFDQQLDYKKGYLWAHDILNPLEFTKERLDKITKIIVQSPWHRTNISEVPDDKIMVSSNGIW